jgi:trk system potassium uptake protein TrkH
MGHQQSDRALSYAVRLRVVGRYVGQLGLVLTVASSVPVLFALLAGDLHFAGRLGGCVGVLAAVFWLLSRLGAPQRIQNNEALVICASMFLIAPLLMVYPLMGEGLSFIDALFEAVSGVTTTGLSTLGSVEGRAGSFLFARSWMQWYGGLGIVALTLALLTRPGVAAKRLSTAEGEEDDTVGGTRAHSRRVLGVYLVLTLGSVALLMAFGAPLFEALNHSLAAVSTGGFSTYDNSIAGLASWGLRGAVMLVSTAGAVSFVFYYRIAGGRWRKNLRSIELRGLVALCALTSGLLALVLWYTTALPWNQAVGHALATGFSAQSTTGFSTLDMGGMHPVGKLVTIGSMLIGGNLGSTAGGIKIVRLLILLSLLRLMLRGTSLSEHAVTVPRLEGRRIEAHQSLDALLIMGLFLLTVAVSWVAFIAGGHAPLDSLFEVSSATGTVGLSTGLVGPELQWWLKGVLCFDMLAGRLEMLALLTMFYPGTWFGRRRD